jgi:hypothetical protein
MGSTTIRVDGDTHAALAEMAREMGASLIDTVRAPPQAQHRHRFGGEVAAHLSELNDAYAAWQQ